MVCWKNNIDSFINGLMIGLALSMLLAISVFVIEDYSREKLSKECQTQYAQEIEEKRLELEGWN